VKEHLLCLDNRAKASLTKMLAPRWASCMASARRVLLLHSSPHYRPRRADRRGSAMATHWAMVNLGVSTRSMVAVFWTMRAYSICLRAATSGPNNIRNS